MRHVVLPTNIGPTIASSIPGGRAFSTDTYGSITTADDPRVGCQAAALLITVIGGLKSIEDLTIANLSLLSGVSQNSVINCIPSKPQTRLTGDSGPLYPV